MISIPAGTIFFPACPGPDKSPWKSDRIQIGSKSYRIIQSSRPGEIGLGKSMSRCEMAIHGRIFSLKNAFSKVLPAHVSQVRPNRGSMDDCYIFSSLTCIVSSVNGLNPALEHQRIPVLKIIASNFEKNRHTAVLERIQIHTRFVYK
jgi:hypothetical protein